MTTTVTLLLQHEQRFVVARLRDDNATVQFCGQQVFNFCSPSGASGGGSSSGSSNFPQETTPSASQVTSPVKWRQSNDKIRFHRKLDEVFSETCILPSEELWHLEIKKSWRMQMALLDK
jgi:hypothetical protein